MKKFLVFILSFIILWFIAEWLVGFIHTLAYTPNFQSAPQTIASDIGVFSMLPSFIAAAGAYFIAENTSIRRKGVDE
ncbi:hypothetical protein [Halobacillus sp. BBL2006]|uniref:hypothetical protein n=1 Tax=Halobacillus sp. BBL2006 TaxID=1543706 RepID=UPI00054351AA|nr:hypothetical protein [Halobacillus sp. BBL2006]KHE66955.1 hypothetical protein LD39_20045 [Halobacillus sp. BBL2006]